MIGKVLDHAERRVPATPAFQFPDVRLRDPGGVRNLLEGFSLLASKFGNSRSEAHALLLDRYAAKYTPMTAMTVNVI